MVKTDERDFEESIEHHLVENGYVKRSSTDFNLDYFLDIEMVMEYIIETQPKEWENLVRQHGEDGAQSKFLDALASHIKVHGTLDALRKKIKLYGSYFEMACRKPESGMNPEHIKQYRAQTFSIIRQLHYSLKDPIKSIDIVLFINGIPIITAELKNPLKGQNVYYAIKQYQRDRDPKEPFLKFKRCLVHFAVDPDLVFMVTQLKGKGTYFFPFNKGNDGGAGNPPNPDGYRTSYLWENVWQKDSLLDIIKDFIHVIKEKDDKGRETGKEKLIFPRYHQLDAVRAMVVHAKVNGAGEQYLIQHSAGSGKSNTISWLAHKLSGLHDADDNKIFNTIIIISDRKIIDRQLQDVIEQFQQTPGTVEAIKKDKSTKLAEALEGGKPIIVTTLQTFPFTLDKVEELSGKRFAIIIDEAHSSQTGDTAQSIKDILSDAELEEAGEDGEYELDGEDLVNAKIKQEMEKRGRPDNISYFAFTATPKPKTMELFGTENPATGENKPFHLYSMKQAIDEKFILDVLQNYTTYKIYFKMKKAIDDDPKFDEAHAISKLRVHGELSKASIREKVEIMLRHYNDMVFGEKINGMAKAMIVTPSRMAAVHYKLIVDKIIQEKHYQFKSLVAFSGTVKDKKSGEEYTEAGMNSLGLPEGERISETQTAEKFKELGYRIMIVANKYQTGFDQPLLHTMYVDKQLHGVRAVQTLSRLNRKMPAKEDTMVIDFVNKAEDIQKSFQDYYQMTILSETTDPNKLYELQRKLEDFRLYSDAEINQLATIIVNKTGTQKQLHAILDPVVERYNVKEKEERVDFKKQLTNYTRTYSFLSQIIQFKDENLWKLYYFTKFLLKKLPSERGDPPPDPTEYIDLTYIKVPKTSEGSISLETKDGELMPAKDLGTGRVREPKPTPLSEIVEYMNDNFGTEFSDEDKVRHFLDDMERRLAANEDLVLKANPELNTKDNFRLAFNEEFEETLLDMWEFNEAVFEKINDDDDFSQIVKTMLFEKIYAMFLKRHDGNENGAEV